MLLMSRMAGCPLLLADCRSSDRLVAIVLRCSEVKSTVNLVLSPCSAAGQSIVPNDFAWYLPQTSRGNKLCSRAAKFLRTGCMPRVACWQASKLQTPKQEEGKMSGDVMLTRCMLAPEMAVKHQRSIVAAGYRYSRARPAGQFAAGIAVRREQRQWQWCPSANGASCLGGPRELHTGARGAVHLLNWSRHSPRGCVPVFRLLPPRMPGKPLSPQGHAAYAVLLSLDFTRLSDLKAGMWWHLRLPMLNRMADLILLPAAGVDWLCPDAVALPAWWLPQRDPDSTCV